MHGSMEPFGRAEIVTESDSYLTPQLFYCNVLAYGHISSFPCAKFDYQSLHTCKRYLSVYLHCTSCLRSLPKLLCLGVRKFVLLSLTAPVSPGFCAATAPSTSVRRSAVRPLLCAATACLTSVSPGVCKSSAPRYDGSFDVCKSAGL